MTIGSAHIRRIDRASTRRIKKMTSTAIDQAYFLALEQGATPISAVDDLSMHKIGPWINNFGKCLARSAKRRNISISGGELAQMPDSYYFGAVSLVVIMVSVKLDKRNMQPEVE